MIKLMAMLPTPETTPYNQKLTEARLRALQCTYGCEFDIFAHPHKVFFTPGWPIVSLEVSPGAQPLDTFVHPEQCYYIAGNTQFERLSEWIHVDYKIVLPVPHPDHPLYGDQALSITLHDRFVKCQKYMTNSRS